MSERRGVGARPLSLLHPLSRRPGRVLNGSAFLFLYICSGITCLGQHDLTEIYASPKCNCKYLVATS